MTIKEVLVVNRLVASCVGEQRAIVAMTVAPNDPRNKDTTSRHWLGLLCIFMGCCLLHLIAEWCTSIASIWIYSCFFTRNSSFAGPMHKCAGYPHHQEDSAVMTDTCQLDRAQRVDVRAFTIAVATSTTEEITSAIWQRRILNVLNIAAMVALVAAVLYHVQPPVNNHLSRHTWTDDARAQAFPRAPPPPPPLSQSVGFVCPPAA